MRSSKAAPAEPSPAEPGMFRERQAPWSVQRPVQRYVNGHSRPLRDEIMRSIECRGQIFVPKTALLQNAGLGLIVGIVDAKAFGVARGPFKVVEQRPHEVTAHIDTLIDGVRDGAYVRFNVGAPF